MFDVRTGHNYDRNVFVIVWNEQLEAFQIVTIVRVKQIAASRVGDVDVAVDEIIDGGDDDGKELSSEL